MGVAVLNPRDCLQNPLPSRQALLSPPPRLRSPRNSNPSRPNRANPGRRKRSTNSSSPPPAAAKGLVMEEVKILKRGEEIPKVSPEKRDSVPGLRPTRRSEETNDAVRGFYSGSAFFTSPPEKRVPVTDLRSTRRSEEPSDAVRGFYAGSAFFTSPPPSSLPLPAFFMKKSADIDDATSGLRRILGLSL